MLCKYCHKKNHVIDNCPSIICRKCNKIGHPKWLCPNSKKNNDSSTNISSNITSNITNNATNNETKYKTFVSKKQTEQTEEIEERNIKYYLKLINKNYHWGNILFNDLN